MGMLEDYLSSGSICGSALSGLWGGAQFPQYPQQLAAMQQQQHFNYRQAQPMQPSFADRIRYEQSLYHPTTSTLKCKKVESKIIETVKIRPRQDVKLLKAGKGI